MKTSAVPVPKFGMVQFLKTTPLVAVVAKLVGELLNAAPLRTHEATKGRGEFSAKAPPSFRQRKSNSDDPVLLNLYPKALSCDDDMSGLFCPSVRLSVGWSGSLPKP